MQDLNPLIGEKFVSSDERGNMEVEKQFKLVEIYFKSARGQTVSGGYNDPAVDGIEDEYIRGFLRKGGFISTSPSLGSRDQKQAEYFLMMAENYRNPVNNGRGGLLVKKAGDKYEPVTTFIGEREYILDFKGTGTPLGTHDADTGNGNILRGAIREYESLLLSNQLGNTGVVPVSTSFLADSGRGQIVRGIAGVQRPSYKGATFPDLDTRLAEALYIDIINSVGQYLANTPPYIPGNHWADNAVLVEKDDEVRAELVDHAEIQDLSTTPAPMFSVAYGMLVNVTHRPKAMSALEYLEYLAIGIESMSSDGALKFREAIAKEDVDKVLTEKPPMRLTEILFESFILENLLKLRLERGVKFSMRMFAPERLHGFEDRTTPKKNDDLVDLDVNYGLKNAIRDEIKMFEIAKQHLPGLAEKFRRQKEILEVCLETADDGSYLTSQDKVTKVAQYLTTTDPIDKKAARELLEIPDDELVSYPRSQIFSNRSALNRLVEAIFP